jgi:protein TonB
MAFHAFRIREDDPGRRLRLGVGALSAVVLVGGLLVGASFASATVKPQEHEVEVRFVENVPEEPAPPPPAPAPPPAPPKPVAKPQPGSEPPPPPPPADEVPTAIPTSTPDGDAPPRAKDGVSGGTPGGVAGGTPGGTGTGQVQSPAPPPAPPPPPAATPKAMQLPEDADPPIALEKPNPPYPDEARAQGIEATITVKFVVTESGDVTDVRVLRGHPLFDAAVIEAVRGWKYKPAMFEGKPIRVYRVVKIPFQLRR